jgi:alkylation response protein AidB-like acyl-CoA dehydrogenase
VVGRTVLIGAEAVATGPDLRAEFRAWLESHPPPEIALATTPAEAATLRKWQRALAADRWVGIHWPVEFGGRGASLREVAGYNEEFARAGAPPLLGRAGITLVGPTLLAHGTAEQRSRWMPRILNGDDVWCQLFSEPDAGSDLAALTTGASRSGDHYVVTGRKVWSSYATFADLGIALVRTDPEAPAHRGISMLAIPMHAAGVEVRPLRQATGEYEFNEVVLDDVVVPADHLVGPEHGGWGVANTTLANERGAGFVWREQVLQQRAVAALIEASRDRGRAGDPVVRQLLAKSWIDTELFRLSNARTLARLERGEEIGADASLVKLLWAESSQRVAERALAVLGPGADDAWTRALVASRANSIMGGTSEIQRTIIGERLLGLPREPRELREPRASDEPKASR